ncbi:hypothetical protein QYF36_016545 [Acer negundo]|nr:hypothetical protein QYF36_016545 [Acer negundo]
MVVESKLGDREDGSGIRLPRYLGNFSFVKAVKGLRRRGDSRRPDYKMNCKDKDGAEKSLTLSCNKGSREKRSLADKEKSRSGKEIGMRNSCENDDKDHFSLAGSFDRCGVGVSMADIESKRGIEYKADRDSSSSCGSLMFAAEGKKETNEEDKA